jgi:hypothetical protein
MLWIVLDGAVLLGDVKMKKKDLVIGARVVPLNDLKNYNPQDSYIDIGIIVTEPVKDALTGNLKVYVKWDPDGTCDPSEEEVSSLELESVAEPKLSKLDAEFKVYEKAVLAKMKEAGKLIREANKLSKKAGVESLNDMYDSTYPLFNAMDAAGWRTSSLGC